MIIMAVTIYLVFTLLLFIKYHDESFEWITTFNFPKKFSKKAYYYFHYIM